MEFVSRDADMVLVNTSPEELKKLAAIIRGVHGYDFVLCEMEVFCLSLMLIHAFSGIGIERLSRHTPLEIKPEEGERLSKDMRLISKLSRNS